MPIKPLDRRTFLRGAGVAIAIPFLDAMLPFNKTWAAMADPKRFAVFIRNQGLNFHDKSWQPNILNLLSPYSSYTTLFKNLDNPGYGITKRGEFSNHRELASFMSGQPEFLADTSVDQLLAPSLNAGTLLPNGLHLVNQIGTTNLSFKNKIQQKTYSNPYEVFNLLMTIGAFRSGSPAPAPAPATPSFKKNVLDAALESIKSLNNKLGASDRTVLDQHLTSIEQLQNSLGNLTPTGPISTLTCQQPNIANQTYKMYEAMPILMDLAALAFRCDLTRTITVKMNSPNNRENYANLMPAVSFPADQTWVGYHSWTHNRVANCDDDNSSGGCISSNTRASLYMNAADEWDTKLFTRFLNQVKDIPGLLDNSGLIFGSGGGPSGRHLGTDIPICLVGKLGNKITPRGLSAVDMSGVYMNNVWLSVLKHYGLPVTAFGSADAEYNFNPTRTISL